MFFVYCSFILLFYWQDGTPAICTIMYVFRKNPYIPRVKFPLPLHTPFYSETFALTTCAVWNKSPQSLHVLHLRHNGGPTKWDETLDRNVLLLESWFSAMESILLCTDCLFAHWVLNSCALLHLILRLKWWWWCSVMSLMYFDEFFTMALIYLQQKHFFCLVLISAALSIS